MAASPVFAGAINLGLAQLANADGTNWKDLFTAGASGSKVTAIAVTSDDTSDRIVQLSILRSGTNYLLGSATIPDLSGTNGVTDPAVDLINATQMPGLPVDNDGMHHILLKSGDKLQVKATVAVTAAKAISVSAIGGDL